MTDKFSCNRAEMRVCAEGFLAKTENLQICTKLREIARAGAAYPSSCAAFPAARTPIRARAWPFMV